MGYDALWFPDHFMLGHKSLEAWTTMTAISVLTSKIKLGSFMLCNNYRNPALVAKMASTLSIISSGRFILGYGAGWYEPEYLAYGYPFPPAGQRIEMMSEALKIIRGVLDEDVFTFKGKYYNVTDAVNEPKSPTRVPIMIGGGGKRILRTVAEFADTWDTGVDLTLEKYKEKVQYLKQQLDKRGRKFQDIFRSMHIHVLIAENEAQLAEKKKRILDFANRVGGRVNFKPSPEFGFEIDKILIGTPDKIREKIAGYANLGCQRFNLLFMDYPQYGSMELFASTVMK